MCKVGQNVQKEIKAGGGVCIFYGLVDGCASCGSKHNGHKIPGGGGFIDLVWKVGNIVQRTF